MVIKKIILALVVILIAHVAKSQIWLEWSEAEILSERTTNEEVGRGTLKDGTPYLIFKYVDTTHFTRRYFFDKQTQRCNLYVVEPTDQKALDTFIQFCGENYTPVGEKRWKVLLNGLQVDVTLEQGITTGQNYFYFEYRK